MCFATEDCDFAMSRIKAKDLCADCGNSDPSWTSINRGIYLCSECCSIHRSIGRHISQIKSLRQGQWSPSIRQLVNQLNVHANQIWEHTLLDATSSKNAKRKPSAKDPLHPVKADFIRAKHVNLAYVLKPQQSDDVSASDLETELSKQLHASVRTANLEVSLRLLIQGADPNFYHEEKGTSPLHVAAKFGQAAQCELLIVYGADLLALDAKGLSAMDLANANKHAAIAERLLEAMYEVTDRISFFICGKKPDHSTGQHFLIPDQSKVEINEQLKIARGKLQLIPNKMFEELVMDLYEEVDRRETEAIWATSALNPEIGAVPFLPTNPHLSATRNQGRQKLARFSQIEFQGLLTDCLIDARRRQNMANLRPIDSQSPLPYTVVQLKQQQQRESNLSDDEPLYDAVASDDDYAALAPVAQQAFVNQSPIHKAGTGEIETLKKKLVESEYTIHELKSLVRKLSTENTQLKSRIDSKVYGFDVQLRGSTSPSSQLVETNGAGEHNETEPVTDNQSNAAAASTANGAANKRPVSMYEARQLPKDDNTQPSITKSLYTMSSSSSSGHSHLTSLPLQEEVKKRTEVVTRRIQELWAAMQDIGIGKKDAFIPCSERIRVACAELTAIFPQVLSDDTLKNALKLLNLNTNLIQRDCTALQHALLADDGVLVETHLQEVRNCAYNLAMATKTLVTHFQTV